MKNLLPQIVAATLFLSNLATADSAASPKTLLEQSVRTSIADYQAFGGFVLPALTQAEFDALVTGESIVRNWSDAQRDGEVSAMGVVGLRVIEVPRLLVWLTIVGPVDYREGRLTPATLSSDSKGSYVRYQHLDLPWPVRDRHWVIDIYKNLPLADGTDGRIWEHRWDLHDSGPELMRAAFAEGHLGDLSERQLDKSIYLPANVGTWAFADLGADLTLVLAYFDVELGGRLPGGPVRMVTRRRLKNGLEFIAARARHAYTRYDDRRPAYDGHGRPISEAEVREAAGNWLTN